MSKDRLLSLDVFRGLTIAAMILVNDPGSWSYVYRPLLHAKWHGCTPTDLIFPFFLYMVGMAVSLGKPKTGHDRKLITSKILKRSLYLFLIGLFLNGFPYFELSTFRIPGVLQRIALVFLAIALMHHYFKTRVQIIIGISLLVGYWIIMSFIPVPGIGEPNLEPETNFAAWFDRLFLSGHMWRLSETWDPEGFLSTLPAVVTGLLGIFSGKILFAAENKAQGLGKIFVLGNVLIGIALAWDMTFPINKSLWTSSFVLYTGGIAMNFYGILFWLLDIQKYRSKLTFPFEVFGSNAITAYALSGVLASLFGIISLGDYSIHQVLFDGLVNIFGDNYFASFAYAVGFVTLCYLPILILYRKKIFIKV
ncbi:acyltransferase family protein [Reichenbachiella sp.]|uniref:acyltransferase family protein n=1 Tax=Reichenbachiella sp. TaxID=2184521 RepID=UPI003B5B5E12